MRIYISVDLEGIAGVVHGEQTHEEGKDYELARRWMTEEVNAAIRGGLQAGATDFLVNDAHGSMRNVLYDKLHPKATLISGALHMMEGVDNTFDAAFLVGYHARMGREGVLNHTISGGSVGRVWVNGQEMGETGINALIAGHCGVPVILATGDHCLAQEAEAIMPWVKAVAVKRAINRNAAASLPYERVRDLISQGASQAVEQVANAQPLRTEEPVKVRLRFRDTAQAEKASVWPEVEREDALTLLLRAPDYLTAATALRALISLGR